MEKTLIPKDAILDFKRRVEITCDVRFQASLRLFNRQRNSTYIISFLSLYVISLSLIPNIVELRSFQTQLLLACSIILSVFIIFTSLIDGAQNFYHQAEILFKCAKKISNIQTELKMIDIDNITAESTNEIFRLQKEYNLVLDECPFNHEKYDYDFEKARKPDLFPKDYVWKWKIPLRMWFFSKAVFLTYYWAIPHFLAILTIGIVVYDYIIRTAVPVGTVISP